MAVVSLKKGFFFFLFLSVSFFGGGEGVGKYYLALIEALAGDCFLPPSHHRSPSLQIQTAAPLPTVSRKEAVKKNLVFAVM